jgi:uncharacterized protein (TIGR03067 family)
MLIHLGMTVAWVYLAASDGGDLDRLQGTWKRVSVISDGKDYPEAAAKQQLIIKGDSYTIKAQGQNDQEGTLKLDPAREPKQLDIMPSTGPNQGKILKGIYKLEGDRFTTCIAPPGKDRPTEFASKPGSGHGLFVNERVGP